MTIALAISYCVLPGPTSISSSLTGVQFSVWFTRRNLSLWHSTRLPGPIDVVDMVDVVGRVVEDDVDKDVDVLAIVVVCCAAVVVDAAIVVVVVVVVFGIPNSTPIISRKKLIICCNRFDCDGESV